MVYWEDDTKPETMGKVRVPWNQTAVTVSGLPGNTQFFLTVSAFNTAGTGPFLPAINVTTKKPRECRRTGGPLIVAVPSGMNRVIFPGCHAAPAQPPVNVEWTLIGSQLSLYWEPVVATESESEVTGYRVSVALLGRCAVFRLLHQAVNSLSHPPPQLSYRRQGRKEENVLTTANSTAELMLPEEEEDYIIRIQTLSEGGLGPASEPVRVHRLSKTPSKGCHGYRSLIR